MIVSTPHGMNLYYKLWTDAQSKKNDYVPLLMYIGQKCQVEMKYGKKKQYETHLNLNSIQSLNVSS